MEGIKKNIGKINAQRPICVQKEPDISSNIYYVWKRNSICSLYYFTDTSYNSEGSMLWIQLSFLSVENISQHKLIHPLIEV